MKINFIKVFSFIIACSLVGQAHASNYYFSAASGDDSLTPTQAQNPNTPWKSINKLNSFFAGLQPGDSVLFKRGDVFYGSIAITKSGTGSSPIILSAYGTGARPVISGLTTLSSWTLVSAGIYQSLCPSCSVNDNLVVVNGSQQPIGRYPNMGYLTYQSHSGNTSITDNNLSGTPNWTGAEVVIRKNHWILDRNLITSHTAGTLKFTAVSSDNPTDGFGYFVQNDLKTLDKFGEWYFDPKSKSMCLFLGATDPAQVAVKTSTVDVLVTLNGNSYVAFNGLSFEGANKAAFQITNSQNVYIQNCDIDLSGADAIDGSNARALTVESSSINHSNNDAIYLDGGCADAVIKNNLVKNTGTIPGMGKSNTGTYEAITAFGANGNIEHNEIDSTGYDGVYFGGSGSVVKNNFINNFCIIKDDGAGIYLGDIKTQVRSIAGNIILNGIGAAAGTDGLTYLQAEGIYTDDNSSNINISLNTVANCADGGIKIHNAHDVKVENNTVYNNGTQLILTHDNVAPNSPLRNIVVNNNIFFAKTANQLTLNLSTIANDVSNTGTFNNNYYNRPVDNDLVIAVSQVSGGITSNQKLSLKGWQVLYGQDANSPKPIWKIPGDTVNKVNGTNKFANGSFNTSTSGSYVYSSAGNAAASWNNNGILDGGCLKVSFSSTSTNLNFGSVIIGIGQVTAGKTYRLKFSMQGMESYKAATAYLRYSLDPYSDISQRISCSITQRRAEREMLFTALTTVNNASVVFDIPEQLPPVYIDNVKFEEVDATKIDADQYLTFVYNKNTAANSFNIVPGVDEYANKYQNNITLQPFLSSIILKNVIDCVSPPAKPIIKSIP